MSLQSNNTSVPGYEHGAVWEASKAALLLHLTSLCPLTVTANVLVIAGAAATHHLRDSSNVLIVCIAVSDLLIGLLGIPTNIVRHAVQYTYRQYGHYDFWSQGNIRCKIYLLLHIPEPVSFTLLVLMTIDRSVAVNYPFFYGRNSSSKHTFIAVFLFVYVTWIAFSLMYIHDHRDQRAKICTVLSEDMPLWWQWVFF